VGEVMASGSPGEPPVSAQLQAPLALAVPSQDDSLGGQRLTVADRPPAARRWLATAIHEATVPTDHDPGPIRLHVRGSICRAPGGSWMDWEGHQSFEADGLGFGWQARLRLARLAWIDAEDRLDAEGGYGGARLLGVIPLGSARGPEVTRLQLVRNLAELAFAPLVASRAQGLVWSADGDDAFTLAAPGIDADAIVLITVDGAGDVRSARSPDRPRPSGRARYLHEPYRLEFDRHQRRSSGERIPLRASGTFETADGDWPYWRFEVLDRG
jgi:hypothetical protein